MMVRRDKVSTHKPLETAGTAGPLGGDGRAGQAAEGHGKMWPRAFVMVWFPWEAIRKSGKADLELASLGNSSGL